MRTTSDLENMTKKEQPHLGIVHKKEIYINVIFVKLTEKKFSN